MMIWCHRVQARPPTPNSRLRAEVVGECSRLFDCVCRLVDIHLLVVAVRVDVGVRIAEVTADERDSVTLRSEVRPGVEVNGQRV